MYNHYFKIILFSLLKMDLYRIMFKNSFENKEFVVEKLSDLTNF